MSPVCRECHNYVLSFPCSHCKSTESLDDRSAQDFKPIVPQEVQGKFDEPPPPASNSHSKSTFDSVKKTSGEPLKSDTRQSSKPLEVAAAITIEEQPEGIETSIERLEDNIPGNEPTGVSVDSTIADRLEKVETSIEQLESDMKAVLSFLNLSLRRK